MIKDYFQDITPPGGITPRPTVPPASPRVPEPTSEQVPLAPLPTESAVTTPDRSIRSVTMPARPKTRIDEAVYRSASPIAPQITARSRMIRYGAWIVAAIVVLVLAGMSLFLFRKTTVTVTPRTHALVFDQSSRFIAVPFGQAAIGAIPYTVAERMYDDTATIPAGAAKHVEERAQGTVTVVNDYSASPVRLIKNTRFETPGGLIYRIADSITVPGKNGLQPGTIAATVIADQPGEKYNSPPIERFSLPGLKDNADMYAHVSAKSSAAFSGGFSGDKPQVDPVALDAARAELRGRLAEKARTALKDEEGFAFPDLMQLSYTSLPDAIEGSSIRIHEEVKMRVPLFPKSAFGRGVGATLSADVLDQDVTLAGQDGFAAHAESSDLARMGESPLPFSLSGGAILTWNIDGAALGKALAGKDKTAFQAITQGFPGVEEARARVEPFWKSTFPADPEKIVIVVSPPADK